MIVAMTATPVAAGTRFTYRFPVIGHSSFGPVGSHSDYPAADIIANCGLPVVSPVDGVVLEVSRVDLWAQGIRNRSTRGGLFVSIKGADGVRYYARTCRSSWGELGTSAAVARLAETAGASRPQDTFERPGSPWPTSIPALPSRPTSWEWQRPGRFLKGTAPRVRRTTWLLPPPLLIGQAASSRIVRAGRRGAFQARRDPTMTSTTLRATEEKFTGDPEAAKAQPTVVGRLADGRAQLSSGNYTWEADLPPGLGGTGSAPTPTQYLLGALAGCAVAFIHDTIAPQLDVPIQDLTATARCRTDARGLLGMGDAMPDLADIELEISVVSSAKPEQLRELERLWLERCPIYLAIVNSNDTRVTLTGS